MTVNSIALDRVLEALRARGGDPKPTSDGYSARCPVAGHGKGNGDENPSLSIGDGHDGWPHLHCFAGCSREAILASLGRTLADIAPPKPDNAAGCRSNETIYRICTVDGRVIAEHVRIDKPDGTKIMFWRRDGRKGLGGLKTKELPLYGSERLKDLSVDVPIVATEGEKAARALQQRGIAAVGTVTGASSVPSEASLSVLADRPVLVWPDNDGPGLRHMLSFAKLCVKSNAASVRIIQWPDAPACGDAWDFFAQGGTREQLNELIAKAIPFNAGPMAATSSLPAIIVNDRQLRDVSSDAWRAVFDDTGPIPSLFVRDGSVTRVVPRGSALVMEAVSDMQMAAVLARRADWFRVENGNTVAVPPPMRVPKDMTAVPHLSLPPLDAIVSTPVFSATGDLLIEEGYYPSEQLILHRPLAVPSVPKEPSPDDVRKARSVIEEVVCDFPFSLESDKTHALAAMLYFFVRRLIERGSPLHTIEAPTPGSGKGLLASAMSIIGTGQDTQTHPFPVGEEEARKFLTATLMNGPPVILLDNAQQGREIRSAVIAAVLTAETWSDRVLGYSRIVNLPNRSLWLMTANNPAFSMEIARRTVRIRLDPKRDRPWERTGFRHPDLLRWTREQRPQIVHALLVLVQHWLCEGTPVSATTLGSFERWSEVIGGILLTAGYEGFLADRNRIYEDADAEADLWREATHAWWVAHRSTPVTVGALRELCISQHLLADVLGDGGEQSQLTKLGKALKAQRDRVYDGLRIELAADEGHKGRSYRLVPAEGPPAMGSSGGSGNLTEAGSPPGSPSQTADQVTLCDDRGTSGNLGSLPRNGNEATAVAVEPPTATTLLFSGSDQAPQAPEVPRLGATQRATGTCNGEPTNGQVPRGSPEILHAPGSPQPSSGHGQSEVADRLADELAAAIESGDAEAIRQRRDALAREVGPDLATVIERDLEVERRAREGQP